MLQRSNGSCWAKIKVMKSLLLTLLLGPALASGAGWAPEAFECPLGLGKPEPSALYMLQIEPIFFSMENTDSCKGSLEQLGTIRDKMLEFHHATTGNLKTSAEESRAVAAALSQIIASLLVDTEKVLKNGELCDGKKLDDQAKAALTGLVRVLYASNSQLKMAAQMTGGLMEITKNIESVFQQTKDLIQAEIDLRDRWFKERGCAALKQEFERLCLAPPKPQPLRSFGDRVAAPPPELPKPKAFDWLVSQLTKRTANHQALMRAMLGQRTTFEKATHPLKSLGLRKDEQPDRSDQSSIDDTFYRGVAPSLQLCGLRKALAPNMGALSPEQDICDRFNCAPNGDGLFEQASRPTGPNNNPFCAFFASYRNVESRYLAGYTAYQKSLDTPKGKTKPSTGSFCPPIIEYPQTTTPHAEYPQLAHPVERLPLVDEHSP